MPWTNTNDRTLRARAEQVIPGGMYGHESTILLPDSFPQFFRRAEGARLWDTDGNEYIDYMCGYGPNLLGYAHPEVDAAAAAQQRLGDTMTGPSPFMVEFAEALVGMVTHADWAMFCKNGTDATGMAAMVARAHTGRRKLVMAVGAYHGAAAWCTPLPSGTLPDDRAHHLFHTYNDVDSLEEAVAAAGDDLAAIFVTPLKHDAFVDQEMADPVYARRCRDICDACGALLVVDDVRAGFRLARDCSWSTVGVAPDLSTWGKGIANGYPISALLGVEKARPAAASIYVTGSFWFAAVPMAAGVKTMEILRGSDYLERIEGLGRALRAGLQEQAAAHGFKLRQTGPVQMPQVLFDGDPDFRLGFGWTEEAMKRGVYVHPWHNMFLCAAHSEDDVRQTLSRTDDAFAALKKRGNDLPSTDRLQFILGHH